MKKLLSKIVSLLVMTPRENRLVRVSALMITGHRPQNK